MGGKGRTVGTINMENSYNFEEFTSFKGKFSPRISLVKPGGFGFSAGFFARYGLNESRVLKLFYDKAKLAVGFKFFKGDENGTVKLKGRKDTGGYVSAISFLNKYGIDVEKYTGRYEPKEIMEENLGRIFVIELKEKNVT